MFVMLIFKGVYSATLLPLFITLETILCHIFGERSLTGLDDIDVTRSLVLQCFAPNLRPDWTWWLELLSF